MSYQYSDISLDGACSYNDAAWVWIKIAYDFPKWVWSRNISSYSSAFTWYLPNIQYGPKVFLVMYSSEPWTRTHQWFQTNLLRNFLFAETWWSSICGSQILVVELSRAPCFYAGRRLHPKLLQLEPKDVAKLCSAYSHLGFQHHTVFKEALKKSPHLGGRGRNVGHAQVVSCRS